MSQKTLTDGEVITSFRQAKNKREQIGILAELNACGKDDILNILCAAGEDVSQYISGMRRRNTGAKYKKWTADDVTILEEGCKNGGSCEDIADALGRTMESVYAKASEMGFVFAVGGESASPPAAVPRAAVPQTEAPQTATPQTAEKAQHRWTEADDEALIELRSEGKRVREIAEIIGCARQSVEFHIAKLKKEGRIREDVPSAAPQAKKSASQRKPKINEDFDRCFEEVSPIPVGEQTPGVPERAVADGGAVPGGMMDQMIDMLHRIVSGMKEDPKAVRMHLGDGDLTQLDIDYSNCVIRVLM